MHGNEGDGYMKNAVQKFGKFLSAMVMPNIGAFIAWGLITALFIEKGWFPNAKLATMVDPMLKYILPVLIGYQAVSLWPENGAESSQLSLFWVLSAEATKLCSWEPWLWVRLRDGSLKSLTRQWTDISRQGLKCWSTTFPSVSSE